MQFVFLRPELCLQLPSETITAPCHPCCSAWGSPYQGPQRTYLQQSQHVWQTKGRGPPKDGPRPCSERWHPAV